MENIQEIENLLEKKESISKHLDDERNKFDDLQDLLSKEKRIYSEIASHAKGTKDGQMLFFCNSINATDVLIALAKRISETNIMPILVLTTMNYKAVGKFLKVNNLEDKVFIIDTVSKNISFVKEQDNIWFVDSLRNLTQLQIKMVKLINKKKNIAFVFDALNVLDLYHSESIILKFTYSIIKLLKKNHISTYCLVTKESLVPKLSQFFDNLVEIKKIE